MLRQGSGSLMGTGTGKRCGGSGSSLGRDAAEKKDKVQQKPGGFLSRSYCSVCHLYESVQATRQLVNTRAVFY